MQDNVLVLNFTFHFDNAEDAVYFAFSYPYTYEES
jgi:hypothetical protein